MDTVRPKAIGVRSAWALRGRWPGFVRLAPARGVDAVREPLFADKDALTDEGARVLEAGGHFAFTVEEGWPLTKQERALMPGADTVWPIQLGTRATADLITSHRLWSDWLGSGRVRKFAMVAEKQ